MADGGEENTGTSGLFKGLSRAKDLDEFLERNQDQLHTPAFHIYITNLCLEANQVPEQVIKRANIERTYGHQLFNGTRKPSRDKVIQLAFGFCLDVDATQNLLRAARKSPLYPKVKRDAVILFCIVHRMDLLETQSILQRLDISLLGDGKND
jgi:hypothetical protein